MFWIYTDSGVVIGNESTRGFIRFATLADLEKAKVEDTSGLLSWIVLDNNLICKGSEKTPNFNRFADATEVKKIGGNIEQAEIRKNAKK